MINRERVEKVWPSCNICKNILFERIGITESFASWSKEALKDGKDD